ncbi:MAG TPA: apolipoprotein N-acyltransferase [Burkholderiales bacterium]
MPDSTVRTTPAGVRGLTDHPLAVRLSGRGGDVLALAAGALTVFAFAPFALFALAVLAPAALFLSWAGAGARRAAWRGFLYGIGLFGAGVSWVYVSLHTYGNMPAPLAVAAVILFVAGLALFPALVGALQTRFVRLGTGVRLAFAIPVLWTLLEWVRGWFLTGFPWLNLGYSQTDTPLAGFAPWVGVYGVSLAVAMSAGLVAAAVLEPGGRWKRHAPLLVLLWCLGWLAGQVSWVQPAGAPLRVALVQANVPLAIKWRPEHRAAIVDTYLRLSESAPQADLYVWPEAAVPGYFDQVAPRLVPELRRIAQERGADFLLGAIERDAARTYYNSVYALGGTRGVYRKRHLVPFGEYLPFPAVLGWVIDYLHIPMSDFSPGDGTGNVVRAAGQPIGVSVCYEDAFGEEIIRGLPDATLLVNVSEDAWFGDSLAPHQRLQMARMRAMESGRPMVRAANTGPSAIIDHRGVVLARSPQFARHVLTGDVVPMKGSTAYARYGNAAIVALLAVILATLGTLGSGAGATAVSKSP